ncbi:hypothetical protein C8F04DRAFT_1177391 [Mycena alexandri]|uniref:Uncharacterized protein n=1 Tax=Mycena alexandri TaxID=1745969 RepID=A0AAD6T7D8_9AGAR|nr:hypothetical protein C8F04DRAFT_1177391 [Mycena alexandri]
MAGNYSPAGADIALLFSAPRAPALPADFNTRLRNSGAGPLKDFFVVDSDLILLKKLTHAFIIFWVLTTRARAGAMRTRTIEYYAIGTRYATREIKPRDRYRYTSPCRRIRASPLNEGWAPDASVRLELLTESTSTPGPIRPAHSDSTKDSELGNTENETKPDQTKATKAVGVSGLGPGLEEGVDRPGGLGKKLVPVVLHSAECTRRRNALALRLVSATRRRMEYTTKDTAK